MSATNLVSQGTPNGSVWDWRRKPEPPKTLTPEEQKRQAHNAYMLARYHQKAKAAKERDNKVSNFNVDLPARGRDTERRIQGSSNIFRSA